MAIKKTKYCAYKPCHKSIRSGTHCSLECAISHQRAKIEKDFVKTAKQIIKAPNAKKLSYVSRVIGYKKVPAIFDFTQQASKKPIRKVSKKRADRLRIYTVQRASFLKNKICPITGRPATEIHHTKGRDNDMLNDIRYWLAVTREGHIWIHANPKEAEEKGYIVKRSTKNEKM